jgi:hypothetical protein
MSTILSSISNLVTFSPSKRPHYSERSHSYSTSPRDSSKMSSSYGLPPTVPGTPKNHSRHGSASISPTTVSPASISSSSYSATRTPSISVTSSSSSQAQDLLSKMASGSGSPPSSRLMTPAMTPFPSPADEGAPYGSSSMGMGSAGVGASRPGMQRSRESLLSFCLCCSSNQCVLHANLK